jgi:hypothetical protein
MKELERVKEDAAFLVSAMVKSNVEKGSCEPVYNFMNRLIAESAEPEITKAYIEFLIDGAMNALKAAA